MARRVRRQLLAMDIPGEASAVDDARAYYAALHSEDRAHAEATQPQAQGRGQAAGGAAGGDEFGDFLPDDVLLGLV